MEAAARQAASSKDRLVIGRNNTLCRAWLLNAQRSAVHPIRGGSEGESGYRQTGCTPRPSIWANTLSMATAWPQLFTR